jgi:hypothetical protein
VPQLRISGQHGDLPETLLVKVEFDVPAAGADIRFSREINLEIILVGNEMWHIIVAIECIYSPVDLGGTALGAFSFAHKTSAAIVGSIVWCAELRIGRADSPACWILLHRFIQNALISTRRQASPILSLVKSCILARLFLGLFEEAWIV